MDRAALQTRLWERIDKSPGLGPQGDCWLWTGCVDKDGYGRIGHKPSGTHQVAWILTYGPIPNGLFVCHSCDNPRCCRPSHLFVGTNAMNLRDMAEKGRAYNGGGNHRKLSDQDVRAIRSEYVPCVVTHDDLGRKYGVSKWTIACLVRTKHQRRPEKNSLA